MEPYTKACEALGIKHAERLLLVRIETQTMQFYVKGELMRSFLISTSLREPSNVKNSLGTPRGLHEIAERLGAGQPPGMVFKSRVSTGIHFREWPAGASTENLITSRILWLRGLEEGVNRGGEVDSHERYIYIHGTNHEHRIGTPQSAGCVLMHNLEIVELYELVRRGDHVLIVD